ncbi:DUF4168 domain-containing protein [Rhodobacteraceae bacterium 63075]|nr:DUF4168 domain-containing protein [Rhodobacteraceae bacterium 63075]
MTFKNKLAATFTAITLAAGPAFVLPVQAQQPEAEVSGAEIDAFIGAYKDVVKIEQDYAQRLQTTEDKAEQEAMIEEAQVEMTQAVEDAPDIEVERYIEILQLAQADTDLQKELNSRLED